MKVHQISIDDNNLFTSKIIEQKDENILKLIVNLFGILSSMH